MALVAVVLHVRMPLEAAMGRSAAGQNMDIVDLHQAIVMTSPPGRAPV